VAVRRLSTLIVALIVLATDVSSAQQLRLRIRSASSSGSGGAASNPIDAARLPSTSNALPDATWSAAGATIQSRSTICSTSACNTMTAAGTSATPAQINAALASAVSGDVVKLACGTYTLAGGIDFNDHDNVTLRGCGPQGAANGGTDLVFTNDTSCNGSFAAICVRNGDANWNGDGGGAESDQHNSATWTAGYSKGTTSITLSTLIRGSKPVVGQILILDQVNDVDTDTGGIWVCKTNDVCADEGGGAQGRALPNGERDQQQLVKVVSISAGASPPWTVTITPGLYMPNWRSGQNPGAWWSNDAHTTGVGIEDVALDYSAPTTNWGAITLYNAEQTWIKNVKAYKSKRAQVLLYQCTHITIRDSYFDEAQAHLSQSYGIETFIASDSLIENNIFHHTTLPISINGTCAGCVVAYNYVIDVTYDVAAWMIAGYGMHEAGIDNLLFEGNIGPGFISDGIHGTHHFVTAFRNRYAGWASGMTSQTNPIKIYAWGRYFNLVGNVLGTDSYHANYATGNATSIYHLGTDPCGTPTCIGGGTDSLVASTLFRWGNYDTVNDANTFSSGEVPSGLSLYAQPVPSSQTLPNSLYLSAKPSFFNASTSNTWPGIGPDVTGGDLSGLNGHAYTNPAKHCYDTLTKDGNGQITNFSRVNCGY
jgi:hypothetical protein